MVRLVSDVQYSIADALVQLFLHKNTPKSILLDTHMLRVDYAQFIRPLALALTELLFAFL